MKSLDSARKVPIIDVKRLSVASKGPRKFGSIGGVRIGAAFKNSDDTSAINFFDDRKDDAGFQVTINTKDFDFKSDML
jgi:hypothetical protein